ncbi:MAG: tetratricopeptide repeat protein [Bryobacteraceae bacterium]
MIVAASALLLLVIESGCDESIKPAAAALEKGDLDRAEAILDSARAQCTQSARFFELAGVANDLAGNSIAAEDAFRKAVSLSPRSAQLLADLGIACLHNNKAAEAAKALEQSAAIDPSDSRVLFTLGTLLGQQGAYEKAIEYLRRIRDKDADDAAYINLGLAYSRLGQFEEARGAYFQAIDKHSGNIEAYFRVGFDYATAGEPRKAIPWLFRAEELSSDRPDIAYALIEQLLQLKYVSTAEDVANAALKKRPGEAILMVAIGDINRQKKNYAAARSKYNEAIVQQPRLIAAYLGLAELAISEAKEDQAREYLLHALSIEPDNPPGNSQLGIIESHQGNWSSALVHLNSAWDRDRSNPSVGVELARALRHGGRLPDALKVLDSLKLKMRDSVLFHAELAQLYQQLHRLSEAHAERERAATLEAKAREGLHFEDPQVYVH